MRILRWKFLQLFGLAWLSVAGLGAFTMVGAQPVAIDRVLAIVNEEAITLREYAARHQREALLSAVLPIEPFDGEIDARILNRMIDDRIQTQIARRRGLRVSPAGMQKAIAFIAKQSKTSPEELFARLNENGITTEQFIATVREQQLIRQLIDRTINARIKVSDREVENYLSRFAELINADVEYDLSHLFLALKKRTAAAARDTLNGIRAAILAGRPFADAAQEFSDSDTREAGGSLGWRSAAQLPKSFVTALESMVDGEVSEILTGRNGLHLLQLHKRRGGGQVVEQQQMRHILIRPRRRGGAAAALAEAERLRARITNGEDFATIARIYSADNVSADAGGMLGWVNQGELPEAMETAMRELPLNKISQPIRSRRGYHLVEVLDRRRGDMNRERAALAARRAIFRRKAEQAFENWHSTLRDTAYIEYVVAEPSADDSS